MVVGKKKGTLGFAVVHQLFALAFDFCMTYFVFTSIRAVGNRLAEDATVIYLYRNKSLSLLARGQQQLTACSYGFC